MERDIPLHLFILSQGTFISGLSKFFGTNSSGTSVELAQQSSIVSLQNEVDKLKQTSGVPAYTFETYTSSTPDDDSGLDKYTNHYSWSISGILYFSDMFPNKNVILLGGICKVNFRVNNSPYAKDTWNENIPLQITARNDRLIYYAYASVPTSFSSSLNGTDYYLYIYALTW